MHYNVKVKRTTTYNEGVIMPTKTVEWKGKVCVHIPIVSKQNDTDRMDIYITEKALRTIFETHFPTTVNNAKLWKELDDKIAAFYFDDEGEELDDNDGGDLVQIGEVAAIAFGYL